MFLAHLGNNNNSCREMNELLVKSKPRYPRLLDKSLTIISFLTSYDDLDLYLLYYSGVHCRHNSS